MHWYFDVLKKYAVFTGRTGRKEYWLFALFHFLLILAFSLLDHAVLNSGNKNSLSLLTTLYILATLLPSLGAAVRRLHDTGRSGWWVVVALVPFIGGPALLVLLALAGNPGPNRYGLNPQDDGEVASSAPASAPTPAPAPASTPAPAPSPARLLKGSRPCPSCRETVPAGLDRCPACGADATHVRCQGCLYLAPAAEFTANDGRCPYCQTSITSSPAPAGDKPSPPPSKPKPAPMEGNFTRLARYFGVLDGRLSWPALLAMPLTFISSYYLNSAIGAGKIVPNLAQNTLIYSGLLSLALMWSCFLMETRLGKIPFAQKILYTALITALAAALVGLFLRFGLGTLKGPYRFIDHTFTPFLAAAVGAGLMCLFLCRISRPFWGFVVGYAALRLGNLLVFVLLGLASNINWGKTLQSLIPSAFLFAGMAYGLLALFSKRSLVQQPGG